MASLRETTWEALDPARQWIAQSYQKAWAAWGRRRYRAEFAQVERFCLFIGYPRSGHSLVGALLNAHRDIVISHELPAHELVHQGLSRDALYARILARASWFNLIGNRGTYPYQIPNQWQGRFERLRVIGDKRGGGLTRYLAAIPDILQRTRRLVGVPLRLIHVVRNPFDNISAMSIWNKLTLEEAVIRYFLLCDTTARLDEFCLPGEVLTLYHEDVIRAPRAVLEALCRHLEVEQYPGYADDCCSILFGEPTHTRRKINWPAQLVHHVETRMRSYPFLDGYAFEIGDERPAGGLQGA